MQDSGLSNLGNVQVHKLSEKYFNVNNRLVSIHQWKEHEIYYIREQFEHSV